MSDPKKALHVSQVGENWEVESDSGTLGQAETQPEAVELAAELAAEAGAEKIEIHTSDGQVVKEIDVPPEQAG
jgi:hypothetical protein